MLQRAEAKARRAALDVEFIQADAERWAPPPKAFDAVMASYLPKYVAIDRWLPLAASALRPGGLLLAHDFTYPPGRAARAGWEAWWRALRPPLARRSGWGSVAEELPHIVRRTTWLPELVRALPRHGFAQPSVRTLTFGAAALVEARRALP
jgi:demethylmenaquinone methyltransferase/2-methoxy-6-polyprenyl-1,4-benzoquinol methylase